MQLSLLLSAAIVVATTASIPIRLGVVLGADNSTTPRHHFSRALTSDQEQWCALRAGEDAARRRAEHGHEHGRRQAAQGGLNES
jgi:hypothetical protein